VSSRKAKKADPVGDAERVVWVLDDREGAQTDPDQLTLFDYDPPSGGPEQPEGKR